MANEESILDELTNFELKKPKDIPQVLEDYLKKIAKTGDVIFPWKKLRPLFLHKLCQVIDEFHEQCPTEHLTQSPNVDRFKFDTMKDKLLDATNSFSCAPFTIQRLCELLTAPKKHYKCTDKFMRGIEKNMLVVSAHQSSRAKSFSTPYEHNSVVLNGVVEPLPENGNSSVQLDSFVTAFSPGNDRLQHSLSNHNHVFNNVETKSDISNVKKDSINMNTDAESLGQSELRTDEKAGQSSNVTSGDLTQSELTIPSSTSLLSCSILENMETQQDFPESSSCESSSSSSSSSSMSSENHEEDTSAIMDSAPLQDCDQNQVVDLASEKKDSTENKTEKIDEGKCSVDPDDISNANVENVISEDEQLDSTGEVDLATNNDSSTSDDPSEPSLNKKDEEPSADETQDVEMTDGDENLVVKEDDGKVSSSANEDEQVTLTNKEVQPEDSMSETKVDVGSND